MLDRIPSRLVPLLQAGLLVTIVILMLLARLEARERHELFVPPSGSVYHLPRVTHARLATLGYHEAAADLAWLRSIIYFGEQATTRGRFEDFGSYVDLVIALDPGFRRIYHWAGVLSIYSRPRITRRMVEQSIHYLELGTKRFPDDGEMHYMLGFNRYFEYPGFLDDPEAKRRTRLLGIEQLKAAVVSGTGPPWLSGMVANLLEHQGLDELAIASLGEALAVVEDRETRENILARIRELEQKTGERAALERWQAFEAGWMATYPYLTLDMYLLVRPRPLFPPEASIRPVPESDRALEVLDGIDVGP
jgi:hypothetical protein